VNNITEMLPRSYEDTVERMRKAFIQRKEKEEKLNR